MNDEGKLRAPSPAERRLWRSLVKSQERRLSGLFLAEGFKVVRELLHSSWTTLSLLLPSELLREHREFLEALPPGLPAYSLPERDWRQISQDKSPEGVIAVVRNRVAGARPEAGGHVLLLCGISNPGNLGAIMRTAHWFGVGHLALTLGSVDYTNPKVVRSSMGSLFHLEITADLEAGEYLRRMQATHRLIAASPAGGRAPYSPKEPTLLIMGSESHGLPPEIPALAQESWTIPGGGAESLSLPQAAAILLYELTRFDPPRR
jgi:TrmH family RNA methyltransferase